MTFMDWAVLMYYNGKLQKEAITEVEANLKKIPQFGLLSETR